MSNSTLKGASVFEDGDEWEFLSLSHSIEKIYKNRNINELFNKEFEFPKTGFH